MGSLTAEDGRSADPSTRGGRVGLRLAWGAVLAIAVGARLWNVFAGGKLWGYDALGHVSYALFVELYRALPWADQGWSYFHPPLYYLFGALLAHTGDPECFAYGLALAGSAASLGVAGIAAALARCTFPERRELALVAFAVAALLPVQLYVSPMPGNKLCETLLCSAAVGLFAAGERRARASLSGDLAVGLLLGLGLLTAASGLLALLAIGASLGVRRWRERALPGGSECLRRALRIAAVVLVLAAPFYARNLLEFGVLFRKSSDVREVAWIERQQGPGQRGLADAFRFPLELFSQPEPTGRALLHSIPGTLYAGWWSDLYRETLVVSPARREAERRWRRCMLLLGLAPTLLALHGAALFARDSRRGLEPATVLPLGLFLAANLTAYFLHAFWVPTWAALKASYCLGATLPYAICSARGALAWLGARPLRRARSACIALVVGAPGFVGAYATTEGLGFDWRGDSPTYAAAQYHLGDFERAGAYYQYYADHSGTPRPWLDNLAAVELARGHPERARELLLDAARHAGRAGNDLLRSGRIAVAAALADMPEEAETWFERGLARGEHPDLLANRGALRASRSQPVPALRDLDTALALQPELCTAHATRAQLLAAHPSLGDAPAARAAERRCRCRAPRRHPFGVGTGEILEWGIARRPLLWLENSQLALADREFFRRRACSDSDR